MIRYSVLTEPQELVQLEGLVRDQLVESRFSYFSFSKPKFEKLVEEAAAHPDRIGVLTAWREEEPVGLIYCSAGPFIVGDGAPITTVTLFYVRPELRSTILGGKIAYSLLKGLESWSKARSCLEIMFHVTFGTEGERIHRFLKRSNFKTLGGSYCKTLG